MASITYNGLSLWQLLGEQPISGPRPDGYSCSKNRLHWAIALTASRVSQTAYTGFSSWRPSLRGDSLERRKSSLRLL